MTARITLLTTNLARGGAESQVASLAQRLAARGWQASVISLLEPSAFREQLASAGVPVFSLHMTPGVPHPLAFLRLLHLLRRLRPQILHCHMFHANLMGRLARLFCFVPVVLATLHSAAESSRRTGAIRWRDRLYRWSDPLATLSVAVAPAVADRHLAARAVSARKVRVIPNGVDTSLFRPDPDLRLRVRARLGLGQEFVWLAAGRLMWKKGYETLLRALAQVPGCLLLIAGVGPQEEELRLLAQQLSVPARFLGHREDVPALMAASDAFVQASVVEGLPLSLLEASSSALPIVATDAGAVREIVLDGRTGFLVPLGDPPALAGAMSRMTALPPSQRQAMGRAAREHVLARFDIGHVITQWEQLYLELLGPWM